MSRIRLYLDEDCCSQALLLGLRTRGWDVRSVHDEALGGRTDEEQLVHAAGAGRVLLTANTRDFCRLHREWMDRGAHHPGIMCLRQSLAIGAILRQLLPFLVGGAPDRLRDQVIFLGP
jgi:Domain of unknown function (DUF5615)